MKLPNIAVAFALAGTSLADNSAAYAQQRVRPMTQREERAGAYDTSEPVRQTDRAPVQGNTSQAREDAPSRRLSPEEYDFWQAGRDYALHHGPHQFTDSSRVNSPSNRLLGAGQNVLNRVLGSRGSAIANDACISSGHVIGREQSDNTVYGRQIDPVIGKAIEAEEHGDLQARDNGFIQAGRIIVQYENHKPAVGANCQQRGLESVIRHGLGFHF